MTICDLLKACEPTYRIDYRDRMQGASWTSWRPLANARYLNTGLKPLFYELGRGFTRHTHHLEGLTRQQALLHIKANTKTIREDIRLGAGGTIEFELQATPDSVWRPYPGAHELRPLELDNPP